MESLPLTDTVRPLDPRPLSLALLAPTISQTLNNMHFTTVPAVLFALASYVASQETHLVTVGDGGVSSL